MRKYLFGSLDVVLAIGMVAFTTPKKAYFDDVFFQYTLSTYTEAQVENPENWIEISGFTCSGINVKACQIKVSDVTTQGTAPNRTLKSTTSIVASSSGIHYYVTVTGWVLATRNHN